MAVNGGAQESGVMNGAQALAWGAMAAQVGLVTGYPGSPATAVYDALAAETGRGQRQYWAPNEKVAMEVAIGASLAGSRSLVILKSVGLNVGLDPLATASLSGCHAGMVIVLGDDPGGWSSQNEQDSRWLARTAELPLVEPIDVENAPSLMVQAFAWSESIGVPVIVRLTGSFAAMEAPVLPPWELPPSKKRFALQEERWVVIPAQVVRRHRTLHRKLRLMQQSFDASPYDRATLAASTGIVAVGGAYSKVCAALGSAREAFNLLGLTSVFPLPEQALTSWLPHSTRLLVVEEGGGFVEQELRALVERRKLPVEITGRDDDAVPQEGELTAAQIVAAVRHIAPDFQGLAAVAEPRELPSEAGLCDGCEYGPFFAGLAEAMAATGGRQRFLVTGETGCMVRAHSAGAVRLDVKLSLGAALGLAIGLSEGGGRRVVALVGDSCFFHSGLNALPLAVDRHLDMTIIVLDNGVTGLTGGQTHPGSGGVRSGRLDGFFRACGVTPVRVATDDPLALAEALRFALRAEGLQTVIITAPCVRYLSGEAT